MQNRWIQILILLLTIALLVLVIFNAPMWLLLLLLAFILLLLIMGWLLGGRPESEEPTEPEKPGPFPNPDYPPEKFIVKDQVIVRGPEATVLRVVDSVSNSIQLILADSINFGELDEAVRECLGACSQIDFS